MYGAATYGQLGVPYGAYEGFGTYGAYGGEEGGGGAAQAMLLTAAISAYTDPYRKVEILRSRLATAQRLHMPRVIIDELAARLRAAERAVQAKKEEEVSTATFRQAGQLTTYATAAVGAAATIYLISLAVRALK